MEVILAATSRILVKEGYHAATTTRVAEVAGVSIGSLYQYFPTRDALVGALIDEHIAEVLGVLAQHTESFSGADASLDDAVRAFVQTVVRIHAVDPELHVALTRNLMQVDAFDKLDGLTNAAREMVKSYLAQHRKRIRPKNLDLAAFILVHSMQAVVSAKVLDGGFSVDDEEFAEELAQLILRYLK